MERRDTNPRDGRRQRFQTFLHVMLGAALAVGVIAGGAGISAALAPQKKQIEFERRELPPEWRWEKPGLELDHMWRKDSRF